MAKRYYRKLSLLAKIETTYGTDPTPTGGANGMLATDVSLEPIAGGDESRDLLLPYLGNQGIVLMSMHARLSFAVEIAGAGAAGSAPNYGPLLRACGFAETLSAGVSAVYAPVSANQDAVTIWANFDGVKHVLLGARGNVSLELSPQRIPRYRFDFTGLLGTITDTVLPATTLTGFQTPITVNKTNTTATLHGFAAIVERLSIDLGNQVEPRLLVGSESIEIVGRSASGSVTLEAALLAAKDWFAIAKARTRAALQVVHGTVAGNIVQFDAPAVELGRPSQGNTQGIINYTLPLMLCPSAAGNDELSITVK